MDERPGHVSRLVHHFRRAHAIAGEAGKNASEAAQRHLENRAARLAEQHRRSEQESEGEEQ